MGYWGYRVVARRERPVAELDAPAAAKGMAPRDAAPGGWQVWEYPGGDGEVGDMNALAAETGAPALFGYVMDSASVVVEAAAPGSGGLDHLSRAGRDGRVPRCRGRGAHARGLLPGPP